MTRIRIKIGNGQRTKEVPEKKPYDYIVYIGRFQPFHTGHFNVLTQIKELTDNIIVFIGSAHGPRTVRNPWTYKERKEVLEHYLDVLEFNSHIIALEDEDSDEAWVDTVEFETSLVVSSPTTEISNVKIGIVGNQLDASNEYYEMFKHYDYIPLNEHVTVHATDYRDMFFSNDEMDILGTLDLPVKSFQMLEDMRQNKDGNGHFNRLRREWEAIQAYNETYQDLPYPPIFTAVDSCIFWKDIDGNYFVILVERGGSVGNGLLALPGGFLEAHEKVIDGMKRELEEETTFTFTGDYDEIAYRDDPNRSQIGRVISFIGIKKLTVTNSPPIVTGDDDANSAKWYYVSPNLKSLMFDDHYFILMDALEGLKND